MLKKINKTKIYAEYFDSLKTESLKIDYIKFNLKLLLQDLHQLRLLQLKLSF